MHLMEIELDSEFYRHGVFWLYMENKGLVMFSITDNCLLMNGFLVICNCRSPYHVCGVELDGRPWPTG